MPAVVTVARLLGPPEERQQQNVTMRRLAVGADVIRPVGPDGPGVAALAPGSPSRILTFGLFLAAPPERGGRLGNFRVFALGDAKALPGLLGPDVRLLVSPLSDYADLEAGADLAAHPFAGAPTDAATLTATSPLALPEVAADDQTPADTLLAGGLFAVQFVAGLPASGASPGLRETPFLPLAVAYDEE